MSFKRHRNRRRAIEEIDDREVWKCPFGCGKVFQFHSSRSSASLLLTCQMYKRTSTVSIRTHNERCVFRLTVCARPSLIKLTKRVYEAVAEPGMVTRSSVDPDHEVPDLSSL